MGVLTIGHADGMVRFLDSKTVLVNDYTHEPSFKIEFLKPLIATGLDCIPVPYNPYLNNSNIDATGIYINYLQLNGQVVLPTFGQLEDELVLRQFEGIFQNVVTVDANELAREGGVLNCISWNIIEMP